VWLPEERRSWYLQEIRKLEQTRSPAQPRSQIVFEGNVPSDLRRNLELKRLLETTPPAAPPRAAVAWLGEAVAIKDPTSATFRRQGGNQLLVIGQDAAAARGIFSSAILSLAAQHPRPALRLFLLDGTPDDDPDHAAFTPIIGALGGSLEHVGAGQAKRIFEELGAELKRRQEGASGAPSVFVFLFDASRFRDLRKSDDDYGFSRRGDDEPLTPAQQLGEILKEGPALGIHVVAWFDTLNNVQRVLDRGALREFEMRVLFQMSANDSSALIDSPAANRLGPNRALFSSEEQGKLEKFRPYGVPSEEWLAEVRERLRARA
jgi:hypothetical protein